MPVPDRLDPIAFEVIRNALVEATEEMASALRRSAYSTNIKTGADHRTGAGRRDRRRPCARRLQATQLRGIAADNLFQQGFGGNRA
jgi:hypothetical protein